TAVTSTHTFLSQSFSLALGTHDLRAELTGDATFVPATLEATLEVVPDTEVNANPFPLNLTTFYPLADGYKNRLKISGQCIEYVSCLPTIEAYTKDGRMVRRWTLRARTVNPYAVIWDGRTATGTLLQAGTYRIRHVIRDWKNNLVTYDQWVVLSHREVRRVIVSVSRPGDAYTSSHRSGTGRI